MGLELADIFSLGSDIHIGLDVGASAVKMIALKNNRNNQPKLVAAGLLEMPAGCVLDGTLSDSRSASEVIKKLLENSGLSYKKMLTNVGMRGLNVVQKRLLLPFQRPEEMAQQVLLEAQQQVDSDLGEWMLDHQVVGKPDADGQVAVMLVAVKRAAVEEFDNMLKLVGVESCVFDCDVFAIENAHEHSYGRVGETIMLLDVGKDSTKINVLQEGEPVLVRSFSLGGNHLTELIHRNMELPMDQAELLKVQASTMGGLETNEFKPLVASHVSEICEEVKRTLDFFATSNGKASVESIDRLVLSGGGASLAELAPSLGGLLKCETLHADPFRNIGVPARWKTVLLPHPHLFCVALGLALRSVGDKPT